MRSHWLLATAALLLAVLAACGDDETDGRAGPPGGAPAVPATPPPGVADRDLGLASGSVFDVPEPPAFAWEADAPGGNERASRMFEGAPPPVPHGITDFLPITVEDNACLECHRPDSDEDGPALPESHRRDLRNAPGVVRPDVAGARRVCVLCHARRSDAADLPGLAPGD